MPYVTKEIREELDGGGTPNSPGELNYEITQVTREYLLEHGTCYNTINDIMGALTGAQLEFYRRVAAPYEDTKITQNGDIY